MARAWLAVALVLACGHSVNATLTALDVRLEECAQSAPPYRCINCITSTDRCVCAASLNVCCCEAPPGHFARGYEGIPCPGGSYQPRYGQGRCLLCNDTQSYYYAHHRGAIGKEDCEMGRCERYCEPGNITCEEQCLRPVDLELYFTAPQLNESFCNLFGIAESSCTWKSSSRKSGAAMGLLLPILLWAVRRAVI
mmetsp:Transcript_54653/g.130415  ORF Transcript_54653/g.130415 Transcript_54653/m.130415 type:complete len:195 (-) Transcript_54653:151-735(-)